MTMFKKKMSTLLITFKAENQVWNKHAEYVVQLYTWCVQNLNATMPVGEVGRVEAVKKFSARYLT